MKALIRLLVATSMISTAFAADLYSKTAPAPVSSAPNWTGFYIGGNGGFGGSFAEDVSIANFGASSFNSSGWFGGAQVGYNYQLSNWVAGIEADWELASIQGNTALVPVTTTDKLDWFGTARVRLGYTIMPAVLLYGTAGYAYGHIGGNTTAFDFSAPFADTESGWVAGAGIEFMVTNHITLKTEYQFIDFGDPHLTSLLGTPISQEMQIHTVRAGLNYKF